MKKVLCMPCAARLEGAFAVKKLTVGSRKETCMECGKRRFCYDWEVRKKGGVKHGGG